MEKHGLRLSLNAFSKSKTNPLPATIDSGVRGRSIYLSN
jgi:hypothetical protein